MYKSERLPIPKTVVQGKGRPRKYPFKTMSVGESFLIPPADQNEKSAKAIYIYCNRLSRTLGKTFYRTVLDDGTIQVIRHK